MFATAPSNGGWKGRDVRNRKTACELECVQRKTWGLIGNQSVVTLQAQPRDENFGKPLNPNFGQITGTRGALEIQFGLEFNF